MSILPYRFYLLIQVLLGLALVISAVLFSQNNSTTLLILSIIGVIYLIVSLASKNKVFTPLLSLLDTRIVVLVLFVQAVLLTFTPQLLGFVTNIPLTIVTTSISAVSLLSLLITKLTLQTE